MKYFIVLTFYVCLYSFSFLTEGKYLVLPSGELHIRDVGPEDGYKSYQCRTKHRLTGETRLSATKGRLVITGKIFIADIFVGSTMNSFKVFDAMFVSGVNMKLLHLDEFIVLPIYLIVKVI